jgi:hypothetical protein
MVMGKIKLILAASFLLLSGQVNASLIQVIQTFHDASLVAIVNGSDQLVTGDWIFKGLTDTTATDQWTSDILAGNYASTVTLTQTSLGLNDELVTNLNFPWVFADRVGFSESNASAPWTRTTGSFSDPNIFPTLSELSIAQHSDTYNTLGQQSIGFQLANGMLIQGNQEYFGLSSSISVSPIPVPPALLLFGTGLLGLIGFSKVRQHLKPPEQAPRIAPETMSQVI